jgi:hypothetical protein
MRRGDQTLTHAHRGRTGTCVREGTLSLIGKRLGSEIYMAYFSQSLHVYRERVETLGEDRRHQQDTKHTVESTHSEDPVETAVKEPLKRHPTSLISVRTRG